MCYISWLIIFADSRGIRILKMVMVKNGMCPWMIERILPNSYRIDSLFFGKSPLLTSKCNHKDSAKCGKKKAEERDKYQNELKRPWIQKE